MVVMINLNLGHKLFIINSDGDMSLVSPKYLMLMLLCNKVSRAWWRLWEVEIPWRETNFFSFWFFGFGLTETETATVQIRNAHTAAANQEKRPKKSSMYICVHTHTNTHKHSVHRLGRLKLFQINASPALCGFQQLDVFLFLFFILKTFLDQS